MRLTIHCDGSCYASDGRMGLGYAFFEDDEEKPFYSQAINKHERLGTSNEAEYLAVINALHKLRRPGTEQWTEIFLYSDSQLIISQITGLWRVNDEHLSSLHNDVHRLLKSLPPIIFRWCPRETARQKLVDELSKKGNSYHADKRKDNRAKV
jgi:ribonuclease HI